MGVNDDMKETVRGGAKLVKTRRNVRPAKQRSLEPPDEAGDRTCEASRWCMRQKLEFTVPTDHQACTGKWACAGGVVVRARAVVGLQERLRIYAQIRSALPKERSKSSFQVSIMR